MHIKERMHGLTMVELLKAMEKKSQNILTNKKREITYGEVLEQWLKMNMTTHKSTTVLKYKYVIDRHIMPTFKDVKIGKINTETLNEFLIEKLNKGRIDNTGGLSPAYVRTMMIIINSSLKYSYEHGYSNKLPASGFLPSVVRKIPKTLSKTEQQLLEKYIENNLSPTCLGILLGLRAGLRVGEVCALTWDNIDFSEKILKVRSTVVRTDSKDSSTPPIVIESPKTPTSLRDIPLTEDVALALNKIKDKKYGNYIASTTENFVSPSTFEYRFHKVLSKCNIKDTNFHALRHTFATRCIEAGVDDKSLSELLGHANVAITLNTYVHSSIELKRKQIEKLSNLMSDKT